MGNIEKLNKFLKAESKKTGCYPIEILMDLALKAGLENFNPYKAEECELEEISALIS
jgi:hypothetical protein